LPETPPNTALTLALSQRRGNRKCPKSLLLGEKGWDEGKLVAHQVTYLNSPSASYSSIFNFYANSNS